MRTFAQKPKATQQTTPVTFATLARTHFGRGRLAINNELGNNYGGDPFARREVELLPAPLPNVARRPIQAKLAVGSSSDALEQEADRVAEEFTASSHSFVGDSPLRMRGSAGPSPADGLAVPASVDRVLASPGRQLPVGLRSYFEPRFGHNFSTVRIHTDDEAHAAAKGVAARAFTSGEHVVFGPGEFAPGRRAGQRLLAHELTHVVQQRFSAGGRGAKLQRNPAPGQTKLVGKWLWAKDPQGKDLPPSLDDIGQGRAMHDCFLFAALAAMVNTDPGQVFNMITDNGDGTYSVTFAVLGGTPRGGALRVRLR